MSGALTDLLDALDDSCDGSRDGDDSAVAGEGGAFLADAPAVASAQAAALAVGSATARPASPMFELLDAQRKLAARSLVPFVREVKAGTRGLDVRAVKRALSRAGYLKWNEPRFTTLAGPYFVRALRRFQRQHTDPKTKARLAADGVYGPATHRALAPYYDSRGIWLLHHTRVKPADQDPRLLMRAAAILTYNHRAAVHYTQGPLRMSGVKNRLRPPRFGTFEDCSSEATWLAYAAGVRDPNGFAYNGLGFTGTLAAHCERVAVPKVGSYALYGGGFPYRHVATVVGRAGGDWVVHSHGSEAGPVLARLRYRGDFHHFVDPLGGR